MTTQPTPPQHGKRRIKFGRWGLLEDPTGAQIVTNDGRLYDVTGVYYRELPACFMLRVRHFNGEPATDIAASVVWLLDRTWEG